MAKTIKEMAHEHVVAYMRNEEYEEMEDTFEAGANAVLEEIEKALDCALEECDIKIGYIKAREIIEQLKGE